LPIQTASDRSQADLLGSSISRKKSRGCTQVRGNTAALETRSADVDGTRLLIGGFPFDILADFSTNIGSETTPGEPPDIGPNVGPRATPTAV
jgi:hypothetical protein